ncbi:MAG TPA: LacI family DNA-binding transcriptional regulator [Microlunatus sp.]|nr:LacI family DNA-binding transcriptional regulator [Microlunatus sp.]
MHDVARAAGVSHQTVSRVLNDHPSVRPETRERVRAAIIRLGYRRNPIARALVTRQTHTIGVLAPASNLFGPASLVIAVEQAARQHGWYVSLASLSDFDPPSVAAAIDHFLGQQVDGLVVVAPVSSAVEACSTAALGIPTVMVATDADPADGFDVVAIDQEAGARLAVRHLLQLGHRGVAHLAGPADWLDAAARLRGWRVELAEAGLPVPTASVGDWSPESGYRVGQQLLADGDLPTAVFAANDLMAIGLVRALVEAGVSVPGQVSVVGFDDIDATGFVLPPLTTVRQDLVTLGRLGVERLLAWIKGAEPADPVRQPPELVVRASTAPPPERDLSEHLRTGPQRG